MADLRFEAKNNQKKEISVSATAPIGTSGTMNDTLFTLPVGSLVTNVYVAVLAASGVALSTVDVKVGTTVVADEVVIDTVGVASGTVTPAYFATGGSVTVVAGATAPDTAGSIKVVVEYVETELSEGSYTD